MIRKKGKRVKTINTGTSKSLGVPKFRERFSDLHLVMGRQSHLSCPPERRKPEKEGEALTLDDWEVLLSVLAALGIRQVYVQDISQCDPEHLRAVASLALQTPGLEHITLVLSLEPRLDLARLVPSLLNLLKEMYLTLQFQHPETLSDDRHPAGENDSTTPVKDRFDYLKKLLQDRGWAEEAAHWQHPDFQGEVVVKASAAPVDCKQCRRLSVSQTGNVYLCLGLEDSLCLTPYLHDRDVIGAIQALRCHYRETVISGRLR